LYITPVIAARQIRRDVLSLRPEVLLPFVAAVLLGLVAARGIVFLLTTGRKGEFLAVTGVLALAQFGLFVLSPPAFFPLLILMGIVHSVGSSFV
jgi:hypothetical protein